MSSIEKLLTKNCTQIAVYWGTPVNDGYGSHTYATPVEVYCRWEEKNQILTDETGEKLISRAIVYLVDDVDVNGLMYLGTLASLSTLQKANPKTIETVGIIKRFEKTPGLASTTQFLRRAFLTPWLT